MRPKYYSQKRYHKSTRKICECQKSLSFNFGEIMSSTEMQEALRRDEMQGSDTEYWEVMPKDSCELYRERRQRQSLNEGEGGRSNSCEEERRSDSREQDRQRNSDRNDRSIRTPNRKKSARRIKKTRKKTPRRRCARSTASNSSCWFDL